MGHGDASPEMPHAAIDEPCRHLFLSEKHHPKRAAPLVLRIGVPCQEIEEFVGQKLGFIYGENRLLPFFAFRFHE